MIIIFTSPSLYLAVTLTRSSKLKYLLLSFSVLISTATFSKDITLNASNTFPFISCYGGEGPALDIGLIEDALQLLKDSCHKKNGVIAKVLTSEVIRRTSYPSHCAHQIARVEGVCTIND